MKKMVKELLIILVVVVMVICLSGCARVNYEVSVNKNGSADVSYVMGYDKEFLNSMGVTEEDLGADAFDDMKNKAIEDGYAIEDYNDDNIAGFKASKHFDNISDFKMNNVGDTKIAQKDQNNEILFEKILLNTKVSQNSKIDLTSIKNESGDNETSNIMNMVLRQMKFSYKVTLPFKVGNNNATTVSEDGKVLEWILTPGEVNEVNFEASENLNTILIGGIICLVVIIVLIIVVMGTKNKNKNNKKEVSIAPKKGAVTPKKEENVKKEENKEVKKEEEKVQKPAPKKITKTVKKEEDKKIEKKEDKE